jgi:hypothetical protein
MSDIFISYSRSDSAKAQTLAGALQRQNWSVWWDPNVQIGQTFRNVISKELDASKCVIVLWSRESIQSGWVLGEAQVAVKRGILVPCLIEDVAIPLGFDQIQTASLQNWNGELSHPQFIKLLKAIAKIIWTEKKLIQLQPLDCGQETSLRSENGDSPTELTFINNSRETIKIYWINYQGTRTLMDILDPAESNKQSTFLTHPFVVVDLSERCLGIYLPAHEPSIAIIGGK